MDLFFHARDNCRLWKLSMMFDLQFTQIMSTNTYISNYYFMLKDTCAQE